MHLLTDTFCAQHVERNERFCAYGTLLESFISAHETWGQHFAFFNF